MNGVRKYKSALPVKLSILPVSLIGRPVNEGQTTLAALGIKLPLTFVPVAVLVLLLPESVAEHLATIDATVLSDCDNLFCGRCILLTQ